MSVLVILLPPRARLASRAASRPTDSATPGGDEVAYVLSSDGLQISRHGRARLSQLPRADRVLAVLADSDSSWHRITCPKAPGAKLRAALGGLLEEQLLDDEESLHLALAPGAKAGEPVWVAALHKPWLRAELERLEAAGLSIERVLPLAWPGDTAQGHFFESGAAAGDAARVMLCHADANGLRLLRLQGSLARALLPGAEAQPTQWTAEPAVAAAAERWLGSSVSVQTEAERALQATRSLWNLRQFDLAPRHRGLRALRDLLRQGLSPAWRPARVGLATLGLVLLAGLNVGAWQQRRALADARLAQQQLLQQTFPKVRVVLDAPAQMQRETDALRAAAGRAGEQDLEALLGAAASAWPEDQGPAQALRFEPGKLTLTAPGWSEAQLAQFRERLRPGGWLVESSEGRLALTRASGGRS